uniref:Calcium-transporting ATPase n=1 Tax=Adineta vaga TaxID=104782 RepID=B3G3X4_ADIVA|nr:plasma membrane calcium ATPase [Adineta vaga]
MASKKEKKAAATDAAGGGDSSMFDITLDQLKELMQERGKDLMEKLKASEYNGVQGVLEKLKVDGNKGLDSNNEQDLEQRRVAYGKNEIPPKPMKSFLRLCWEALHDMLLIILLVCAVVSIGLSFYKPPKADGDKEEEPNLEWIEGVAILVAVLVVVFVTAINDWRKERQFRGLESKIEKDQQASVIRDNGVQQIPVNELVVGDLCFIKYGDLLPADGLIVQSSDLKIDESSITGETDLVKKSLKEDVGLLSGTNVMEGSGRMLVVGVGLNSQVGSIMSLLGATADDSKKKGKKDKKKDKEDGKKNDKKPKPISSTKVAPDRSTSDEKDTNVQTIETVNETKQSSANHPRVKKLPEAKQSSTDEHEMKPTKSADTKENNDDKPKKSSSSNGDDDDNDKNKSETKKPVKTASTDEEPKKSSSASDDSDDEQKKKSDQDTTEPKLKKSSSGEIDKIKSEKKESNSDEEKQNADENATKKSSSSELDKDKSEEEKKNKESSSSEVNDDESEKKSNGKDKQEKTLTKTKSDDDDDDEEKEKKSETSKQKESDDRPTTSPSDDKNKKKDAKEDLEKKPAGLAATAEKDAAEDDEEEGSKSGKQKSVLQTKLTRLALVIGYIGMSAAALTLVCLIVRFCITTYVVKKQKASAGDVSYFISFLIQAITVVVVSVPEGLPLAVTLALAYAVRKMMTDNNLVRHLDACETMGNASTICSDKTGTLTTNRMTVVQSYFNDKHFEKLPKKDEINKDLLPLLFEAVTVNANYTSKIEKSKDDSGLPKQVGNKTECALLDLVLKWDGSYDEIRKNIPEEKLAKVFTFNSARKMMSTIIEREEGYRVYTKGASEMVLTICKSIIDKDNKPRDLSEDEKKKITKDFIEKMANDGLRTICIAYKDLGKEKQNWDDDKKIVNDLICIGIVGIEDPVRDEVPEAIEKCQKAGVVVRMVTGDNITTARSIATKCGIIKPEDDFLILEGKEFNKRIRDSSGKISQKKLDEVWPKLRVLARSSPQDKYNLVNGIVESQISANREVVAVTGDGTNDGPALKRADVGFAMGIQGTDVAKQASDIILTDDNFSSIVKAMMWGRNVYDCIAKFLQFQLTANLSAGVLSVISAAAISSVPLRAVQMLWVNLVMDTLASLALATEPPTEDLLNRKPYGRTKSIISSMMMRNIIGQSLYQLIIMFVILYAGQYFLDVESTVIKIQSDPHAGREISEQFTLVFNAFVLMTLFNEINSRKLHGERNVLKGIHRNPFFYGIWIFCFIAQIIIVTFGDKVFSCARLDIKQWAWSLLFGLGSLVWQQILLFIPIEPFSRCFSGIYRICCPCLYKRQKKFEDDDKNDQRRKSDDKSEKKRSPKKDDIEDDNEKDTEKPTYGKYSTVAHLTNATVVIAPPPIFARYMLRKSVDRLNTEFEVINAFRSRLEALREKKDEIAAEQKRNSQGHLIDE